MNPYTTSMTMRPLQLPAYERLVLWLAGCLYLVVVAMALRHHEPWGDEVHSWNIAKGSGTYLEVIRNSRFEGHPPVWYTILWLVSKCTHNYVYVQLVHGLIAAASVFLILFYAPLPLLSRLLLPFGYYLLYEYAVISRNYAIGVLLACCLCVIMHRRFRYKTVCYYGLLLLLSNTHLLGWLLAASIHLSYMVGRSARYQRTRDAWPDMWPALLCLLPAGYFILPPADSALDGHFWLERWQASNFIVTVQSPLRAMVPVPAWWEAHWWNTECLLAWQARVRWFKYFTPFLSLGVAGVMIASVRRHRPALWLLAANLLGTAFISIVVFPIGCARYAGFLFVGWLAAWWLAGDATPLPRRQQRLVNGLLAVQVIAALVAIGLDWSRPFSQFSRIQELMGKVPAGQQLVCDYWGLNAVSAFADRPMYCLDLQQEVSFLLWDGRMAQLMRSKERYTTGARQLVRRGVPAFYMISSNAPAVVEKMDAQFTRTFRVSLAGRLEGAIEAGGNLYLYAVIAR